MTDRIDEQMKAALAAYGGPVKHCPPGEVSAEPVKPKLAKIKPVEVNKALPLRRKPRPLSIVVEARAMSRDKAARWLESWRRTTGRRHWLGAAARRAR